MENNHQQQFPPYIQTAVTKCDMAVLLTTKRRLKIILSDMYGDTSSFLKKRTSTETVMKEIEVVKDAIRVVEQKKYVS